MIVFFFSLTRWWVQKSENIPGPGTCIESYLRSRKGRTLCVYVFTTGAVFLNSWPLVEMGPGSQAVADTWNLSACKGADLSRFCFKDIISGAVVDRDHQSTWFMALAETNQLAGLHGKAKSILKRAFFFWLKHNIQFFPKRILKLSNAETFSLLCFFNKKNLTFDLFCVKSRQENSLNQPHREDSGWGG